MVVYSQVNGLGLVQDSIYQLIVQGAYLQSFNTKASSKVSVHEISVCTRVNESCDLKKLGRIILAWTRQQEPEDSRTDRLSIDLLSPAFYWVIADSVT